MDNGNQSPTIDAPSLPQATFLKIAFDALSVRAARWATLVMSFALFGAAVWWPDWKRAAAAAGFTVLVQIPVWLRKEK